MLDFIRIDTLYTDFWPSLGDGLLSYPLVNNRMNIAIVKGGSVAFNAMSYEGVVFGMNIISVSDYVNVVSGQSRFFSIQAAAQGEGAFIDTVYFINADATSISSSYSGNND